MVTPTLPPIPPCLSCLFKGVGKNEILSTRVAVFFVNFLFTFYFFFEIVLFCVGFDTEVQEVRLETRRKSPLFFFVPLFKCSIARSMLTVE